MRRMDDANPGIEIFDGEEGENGVDSSLSARIGYLVVVTGEEETHKATRLLQVSRQHWCRVLRATGEGYPRARSGNGPFYNTGGCSVSVPPRGGGAKRAVILHSVIIILCCYIFCVLSGLA